MVLLVSIAGIAYSSYFIISTSYTYKKSEQKYAEIAKAHEQSQTDTSKDLHNINEDYLGWIKVKGTNVNYPIVKGNDNEFYLTHNFYKEPDKVGSIFMDYRNSSRELDKNLIIYGHNMKDESMFATLRHLLDQDFFEKNKKVTLEFLDKKYEWEIFSAYVTQETDWMEVDFTKNHSFIDFAKDMASHSYITNPFNIQEDDHIITLATCTNHIDDERVVVHGKLVKEDGK